jgi:exodeoxyribonuclease VII small subunit
MPKKSVTYQALSQELEQVLQALQSPGVHVDEAVALYESGLKLVAALQQRLKEAENTIDHLKVQTPPVGREV